MDKNDIEIIRLLVRDKGGVMERRSWKSICKTLEARSTVRRKPLKAEIADYLDREICSNVATALRLAEGVSKIIRQSANSSI